jgi:hypothetical protein
MDHLPGRRIRSGERFAFHCGPELACFNRCCRNLNLFLYPYDALRLYRHLGIGSNEFIDRYTDLVLRPGHFFPEVLLRMADNAECTCPFLQNSGCGVYAHRPDTCRSFPVEQGEFFDAARELTEPIYLFRPPDFCLGRYESQEWTVEAWLADQEAQTYQEMTQLWAGVRRFFQNNPWGAEGFAGAKGRMAFMAAYNLDRFREFVFDSTFLKRYRVNSELVATLRQNDTALLKFGFEWIRFFVWGIASKIIRPR